MPDGADELLVVMLEARIAEFEKRMKKAEGTGTKSYQNLRRGSRGATQQMEADMARSTAQINAALANTSGRIGVFSKTMLAGLAGAAISQGLARMVGGARQAIKTLADLADAADLVGVSTDTMQGLQRGFGLAGVEQNEFNASLQVFSQRLGEAIEGTGDLYKHLEANNIALRDQNGQMRPTVDVLGDYADLIARTSSEQEQLALATDAFGRAGRPMVLALREGSAGLDQMVTSAREAGLVLEEDVIRRAAELDDKIDDLTLRFTNFFQTTTVGWAQMISDLASVFEGVSGIDRILAERQRAAAILGEGGVAAIDDGGATEQMVINSQNLLSIYAQLQGQVRDIATCWHLRATRRRLWKKRWPRLHWTSWPNRPQRWIAALRRAGSLPKNSKSR